MSEPILSVRRRTTELHPEEIQAREYLINELMSCPVGSVYELNELVIRKAFQGQQATLCYAGHEYLAPLDEFKLWLEANGWRLERFSEHSRRWVCYRITNYEALNQEFVEASSQATNDDEVVDAFRTFLKKAGPMPKMEKP